jgi:hypothetical protein
LDNIRKGIDLSLKIAARLALCFLVIAPLFYGAARVSAETANGEVPVKSPYDEIQREENYKGLQTLDMFPKRPKSMSVTENMYNDIYRAIINLEASVNLRAYGQTYVEVFDALQTVLNDHPEIFYYKYSGSRYWTDGKLELAYKYTKDEIIYMNIQQQNIIDRILAENITPDMTPLRKEIAFHDYLVRNSKYDKENALNNTIPEISHTAYGILVNGTGVCDGYAKAFKLLLNRVNINSIIVISDPMNHAWNLVELDGSWYHTDVTWDDPTPDRPGATRYTYLNLSDTEMGENHIWSTGDYPSCTSNKYSYFKDMNFPVWDGDYIYYSDKINDYLSKINYNGTGKQTILNERALYLCQYGDWIYFSNYSRSAYISKVKKDGQRCTQVNSRHSRDLRLSGNILTFYDMTSQGEGTVILEQFYDLDEDEDIDAADINLLARQYNSRKGNPVYKASNDYNNDTEINLYDLVILSKRYKVSLQ